MKEPMEAVRLYVDENPGDVKTMASFARDL